LIHPGLKTEYRTISYCCFFSIWFIVHLQWLHQPLFGPPRQQSSKNDPKTTKWGHGQLQADWVFHSIHLLGLKRPLGHTMKIGCLWPQVGWVLLSQLHMLYHSYIRKRIIRWIALSKLLRDDSKGFAMILLQFVVLFVFRPGDPDPSKTSRGFLLHVLPEHGILFLRVIGALLP